MWRGDRRVPKWPSHTRAAQEKHKVPPLGLKPSARMTDLLGCQKIRAGKAPALMCFLVHGKAKIDDACGDGAPVQPGRFPTEPGTRVPEHFRRRRPG